MTKRIVNYRVFNRETKTEVINGTLIHSYDGDVYFRGLAARPRAGCAGGLIWISNTINGKMTKVAPNWFNCQLVPYV